MSRLQCSGRRYSGYKRDSEIGRFEGLIATGINAGSVGMSLFRLPGWLRDLGRCNLESCFVLDMVNAHAQILNRRHQGLEQLREYVDRREEILASIPAPRKAAKLLFIRPVSGRRAKSTAGVEEMAKTPGPPYGGGPGEGLPGTTDRLRAGPSSDCGLTALFSPAPGDCSDVCGPYPEPWRSPGTENPVGLRK